MKDCTYYDILGVPTDATIEQIVAAKNFLVKKFHPDVNINCGFDTTSYMQNILDAYQILGDPRKRRIYDHRIADPSHRNRSGGQGGTSDSSGFVSPNFAPYWEAANKLNDIVNQAAPLFKNKIIGKSEENKEELREYASLLKPLMKTLEAGEIPKEYWHAHAINWILFQWTQNRDLPYPVLFSMYNSYVEQRKSMIEKMKITSQAASFMTNLDRIIAVGIS